MDLAFFLMCRFRRINSRTFEIARTKAREYLCGREFTPEHRKKISAALTGRIYSEEALENMRKAWLKRPAPDSDAKAATKAKRAASVKASWEKRNRIKGPLAADHKNKLSLALRGRKRSEQTIEKIRTGNLGKNKGRNHTQSTRDKIAAASKARHARDKINIGNAGLPI